MKSILLAAFTTFYFIFLSQVATAEDKCDPASVEMATTPAPANSLTGQKRAKALAKNTERSADIILIGDSLLANWSDFATTNFPGKKVWNFSVGGDRTQNVLWRYDATETLPENPAAIVMLLGTNNLSDNIPACAIYRGVDAVIGKTREKWPNTPIFTFGVLPRGADFKQYDGIRQEINARLGKRLSDLEGTYFVKVDDSELTCSTYGKASLPANTLACFPENAYTCGNFRKDNLHLQEGGYKILERALRERSLAAFTKDIFN